MQVSGMHEMKFCIFPPTPHSSLSLLMNLNAFLISIAAHKRLRTQVGIGKGELTGCWNVFHLEKSSENSFANFPLSLYSFFFIASLVFNQHWQKRRFTFFRNFLRLGAIILQPGGVCCRLSSARLALSAPFSSDNDNDDDGRGIMGERKWMEKRWRWAEKEEWRGINYFTVECLRRRRHLRQRWSLISIFFDC